MAINEPALSQIRALMLDIDGVLLHGDEPIPGACEAVSSLADRGYILRFVTNTTKDSRSTLLERLRDYGIPVEPNQLFTVASLARRLMSRNGNPRYRLLGSPDLEVDLGPGRLVFPEEGMPDWVVLGLHTPSFTHDVLCIGLRDLLGGAKLIALHANRMWKTKRGIEMGLGSYVKALEYASRTEAIVMGKPSSAFFGEVLEDLGLGKHEVLMVGDDVESDIGGAQAAGIGGILVRTGKFSQRSLELAGVQPDLIVDDIVGLAGILPRQPPAGR